MNWGNHFPSSGGAPAVDFPWGWFSVTKANDDPAKDFSFICGIGLTWFEWPTNNVYGRFADLRLDADTHVGARAVTLDWGSWREYDWLHTSNDGDCLLLNITRYNWTEFHDSHGSALIPLRQIVTMQTETYLLIADFQSDVSEYNRLVFPAEDFLYSDFEALGVTVHLSVFHNGEMIISEVMDDGGLEYGYHADMHT